MPSRHNLLLALLLCCAPTTVLAVTIDGHIEAGEWADARRISDFRLTQPLTREPAPQPTEAFVLATPEGLAIAFRNEQSAQYPRTHQHTERDVSGTLDRVNVYVDFDGDGRAGYNFMVTLADGIADATISNESRFNNDWDGDWQHATSEDDSGWTAELLIPWHVATMHGVDGDTRTIGLSLDRVIGSTGERMSWPAISGRESRFLSAFERIGIASYSQSLFAITPYVVGVHDLVRNSSHADAGADLFWKPNGRFQLSATLNPDFAQVESDDLEVNFSAVESFFSDKRPFFTENQGYFDVPFGALNGRSRLIYTRRVGAGADDGSGAASVDAAVKLNGSAAGYNVGVFAATESGSVGRDFFALRASRDFEQQGIGAMLTQVNRPFLGRTANVYELDHRWTPNAQWSVRSALVGSQIDDPLGNKSDSGFEARADYDSGGMWRQQVYALHLGRDLQLNDFGYLERNNLNYLRYELGRRVTDLPADSAYSGHDWRYAISRRVNNDGVFLSNAAAISRDSQLRNGGFEFIEVVGYGAGHDDRITRGNGVVDVPGKIFAHYERAIPQGEGRWSWEGSAHYAAEGLGGPGKGGLRFTIEPIYHASDRLSHSIGMALTHNPDWLLWRDDNLLGTYRQNLISLSAGSTWLIDKRQQLRLRLEAIGLDGSPQTAWRVCFDGRPMRSDDILPAINVRSLAFQIRYRYELAPLSYLYLAYVRGGETYDELVIDGADTFGASRAFRDAFSLRDSEQFLVKLSYRFD